jgi:hypothetical protein
VLSMQNFRLLNAEIAKKANIEYDACFTLRGSRGDNKGPQ